MKRPWIRTAVVLSLFSAVFLTLVVGSYRQESATIDEPHHLLHGYAAWRLHDYRIDPEHPPLVWMWAALPLLSMPDVQLDTSSVSWRIGDRWGVGHEFLYKTNDADRVLYRGRFMIALLGVLLGILVFCWARELFGFWPAIMVLGLFATEPNLVAHSGLVTNDVGVSCFIFGAVYCAWRLARQFSVGNLTGMSVFFGLALVSKYSAALLVPILLVLLLRRAVDGRPWPWTIGRPRPLVALKPKMLAVACALGAVLIAAYVMVWAVYGFRYVPTPPGGGIFVMEQKANQWPVLAQITRWVDEHQLIPNASAQGFALAIARVSGRQSYFCGQTSTTGWWYYFPIAILIKTPLALLVLAVAGLALCVRRWKTLGHDALFVLLPPALVLGTAMTNPLNIGLRHILAVYPFLILSTGWAVAALWSENGPASRRCWRRGLLAAVCFGQLVEFALVYPYCLAFFNASVGGARRGAAYLVDSNLDWGQGLKLLGRWMREHRVDHVNLSYFGDAEPAYYGIKCTLLPGQSYLPGQPISAIRLPGYVAISATNLRGAYLNSFERNLYAPLREQTPVAVLGYSLYVYWVEKPWW